MSARTLPMQGRLPDFLRMQASRDSKPVRENLMSQAADALEAQEKRIADLEGALRGVLPLARGWSGVIRRQYGHHSTASASVDVAVQNARRVLGGGK